MTSPLGLFVQVSSLPSAFEVSKWFGRIVKDHRRKGSPFYISNLALESIAQKDSNGSIVLSTEKLDLIKDYLLHFDNMFVGSPEKRLTNSYNICNSLSVAMTL